MYFVDNLNHLIVYFPLLIASMTDQGEKEGYAKDHIYDVVSAFANYIFKYNDLVIYTRDEASGLTYLQMLLNLCVSFFRENFKPDNIAGCKILS
jgi:hypothetical protein